MLLTYVSAKTLKAQKRAIKKLKKSNHWMIS